jgi:hypothetical protein
VGWAIEVVTQLLELTLNTANPRYCQLGVTSANRLEEDRMVKSVDQGSVSSTHLGNGLGWSHKLHTMAPGRALVAGCFLLFLLFSWEPLCPLSQGPQSADHPTGLAGPMLSAHCPAPALTPVPLCILPSRGRLQSLSYFPAEAPMPLLRYPPWHAVPHPS